MKIEKIIVQNFQAQRYLEIDLQNQITSIIGESDVGKSSTIRALIWVLTNKAPADFISWGESECRVTLLIDGHEIIRLRNKSKNVYLLDGKEFACLRQGVPPEIDEIFKISSDNIQNQYDLSFWFSDTGGELAKKINAIINLDVIDFVFSNISSMIRDTKSRIEIYEERLRASQQKAQRYHWLPEIERQIQLCRKISQKREAMVSKSDRVRSLISKLSDHSNKIDLEKKILHSYDSWHSVKTETLAATKRSERLKKIVMNLEKLKSLKDFDFDTSEFRTINKLFAELSVFRRQKRSLQSLIDRFVELKQKKESLLRQMKSKQKQLDEAMKGKCPLCGRSGTVGVQEIINECCVYYDVEKGTIK